MANIANLQPAPPFTSLNAAEMGRRSGEARRAKIAARERMNAKPAIEPEINRIVSAMKKLSVTSEDYARLSGILDRLWSKAFPTQGTAKPSRQRGSPSIEPLPTPQEPLPPAGQNPV